MGVVSFADEAVKYWDEIARGQVPPSTWNQLGFNDSGWSNGTVYLVHDSGRTAYIPAIYDRVMTHKDDPGFQGPVPLTEVSAVGNTNGPAGIGPGKGSRVYCRKTFTSSGGEHLVKWFVDNQAAFYIDGVFAFNMTLGSGQTALQLVQGVRLLAGFWEGDSTTNLVVYSISDQHSGWLVGAA